MNCMLRNNVVETEVVLCSLMLCRKFLAKAAHVVKSQQMNPLEPFRHRTLI